jgi:hypothetical protein
MDTASLWAMIAWWSDLASTKVATSDDCSER